jgi:hypothetical protein
MGQKKRSFKPKNQSMQKTRNFFSAKIYLKLHIPETTESFFIQEYI